MDRYDKTKGTILADAELNNDCRRNFKDGVRESFAVARERFEILFSRDLSLSLSLFFTRGAVSRAAVPIITPDGIVYVKATTGRRRRAIPARNPVSLAAYFCDARLLFELPHARTIYPCV